LQLLSDVARQADTFSLQARFQRAFPISRSKILFVWKTPLVDFNFETRRVKKMKGKIPMQN